MPVETSEIVQPEVRWVASHSANCFHAADALRRGCPLADRTLVEVIETSVERLSRTVRELSLDEESFWANLVPLSANIENNTQLVEQVLRKMIGGGPRTESMVSPLAGRVADVEAAVRRECPELIDRMAAMAEPFAARWQQWGRSLLGGIARRTDPRFLVSKAEVILVPAVCGGSGVAHLPYNTVRIEAVEGDPTARLPEVVRLAWLIAQLNVDLPMFSELIHRDRQPLIAAAAMLPATLEAADELHLADNDAELVALALDRWHVTGPATVDLAEVIPRWWQSHLDMLPPWNVSLAALDRMIHDEAG